MFALISLVSSTGVACQDAILERKYGTASLQFRDGGQDDQGVARVRPTCSSSQSFPYSEMKCDVLKTVLE